MSLPSQLPPPDWKGRDVRGFRVLAWDTRRVWIEHTASGSPTFQITRLAWYHWTLELKDLPNQEGT